MDKLKLADLFEAEEKSKRELAEDLHDHLGQALALMRITLKKVQGNAVFCGFENDIEYVLALTDKCIRYSRDIVSGLNPSILQQLGLVPALESLVETCSRRHKVEFSLNTDCEYSLGSEKRTYIYRSVNELVVNIIKHSEASEGTITITHNCDSLIIHVRDNGIGIPKEKTFGFGLMSITERVGLLEGSFEIVGSEKGTTATISVPLEREEWS